MGGGTKRKVLTRNPRAARVPFSKGHPLLNFRPPATGPVGDVTYIGEGNITKKILWVIIFRFPGGGVQLVVVPLVPLLIP